MDLTELKREIERLRGRPLTLVCRTPEGRERVMGLDECVRTGSRYLYLARDELDAVLCAALSGDTGEIGLPAAPGGERKRLTKGGRSV